MMISTLKSRCCALITVFVLCLTSYVQAQVVFKPQDTLTLIGKSIQYYVDSSETKTINDVLKFKDFKSFDAEVPNLGVLKFPVWLKLSITNQSQTSLMLEFGQPMIREIDFFYQKDNQYQFSKAGEDFPFNARMTNYHKFVYNLNIPTDSTQTFYLRVQSSQKMIIPLSLGTKDAIIGSNLSKNLLFGIFCGIVIVMFFYNLFIYFTVKDSIYLYYVVYILIVGLTQITIEGYTFQYLWPNNTFLASRSFFLLTALVNISGLEFVRKFLNIRQLKPSLIRYFFIFYAIYTVAILATLSGSLYFAYGILQGFAGLVSLFILFVSVVIAGKNYRPAKFFLVAWLPLLTGIFIYVMREFNILPYNFFTNYSISFGTALEVILLSFALADKINILKREKDKSQEETLKALHENERIVREQNVMLEEKVKERTEALEDTNHNLNRALENLKEAQSQLVDAEKMAGLGQLTAGIAHEINNPINFVTSNIKPLELDIVDLNNVINMYEKLDPSESLEQQIAKIEAYKKQIDLPFVRDEIKSLLSGITEGAKRTAEIIRSLKNFSRLDENDTKAVDLNEGLASTLVLVRNTFPDRLNVIKDFGSIPKVECMPGKINQVFMNLITNAIHAIKKKDPSDEPGTLAIKTWQEGDEVKISIKDSGTGMSEEVKQKIFEPFFTTKDIGEGTGLGLSIVFRIIENHRGYIDVNSKINQGTEFIITLPVN